MKRFMADQEKEGEPNEPDLFLHTAELATRQRPQHPQPPQHPLQPPQHPLQPPLLQPPLLQHTYQLFPLHGLHYSSLRRCRPHINNLNSWTLSNCRTWAGGCFNTAILAVLRPRRTPASLLKDKHEVWPYLQRRMEHGHLSLPEAWPQATRNVSSYLERNWAIPLASLQIATFFVAMGHCEYCFYYNFTQTCIYVCFYWCGFINLYFLCSFNYRHHLYVCVCCCFLCVGLLVFPVFF